MALYRFDSNGVYMETDERHEALYHCERGNHDAPVAAFQITKTGAPFKSCTQCMQDARRASLDAQGKSLSGKRKNYGPFPTRDEDRPEMVATLAVTIVDDGSVAVALDLVTMLRESRAEILSLREWLSMDADASAFLSGADLFIYKDGRIYARRPDGSNVEDPIEPAAVRMLAGDRIGIVFF